MASYRELRVCRGCIIDMCGNKVGEGLMEVFTEDTRL